MGVSLNPEPDFTCFVGRRVEVARPATRPVVDEVSVTEDIDSMKGLPLAIDRQTI